MSNEKGNPNEMDLPSLKNDITSSGLTSKLWINSSNMHLGYKNWDR